MHGLHCTCVLHQIRKEVVAQEGTHYHGQHCPALLEDPCPFRISISRRAKIVYVGRTSVVLRIELLHRAVISALNEIPEILIPPGNNL